MQLLLPIPAGHFAGGKNITGSQDADSLEHLINQAGGRKTVVSISDADSPYAVGVARERDVILVDSSAGAVVLNFADDLPVGFELTLIQSGANTVTVAAPGDAAIVRGPGTSADQLGGDNARADILVHAADTIHLSGNVA